MKENPMVTYQGVPLAFIEMLNKELSGLLGGTVPYQAASGAMPVIGSFFLWKVGLDNKFQSKRELQQRIVPMPVCSSYSEEGATLLFDFYFHFAIIGMVIFSLSALMPAVCFFISMKTIVCVLEVLNG